MAESGVRGSRPASVATAQPITAPFLFSSHLQAAARAGSGSRAPTMNSDQPLQASERSQAIFDIFCKWYVSIDYRHVGFVGAPPLDKPE